MSCNEHQTANELIPDLRYWEKLKTGDLEYQAGLDWGFHFRIDRVVADGNVRGFVWKCGNWLWGEEWSAVSPRSYSTRMGALVALRNWWARRQAVAAAMSAKAWADSLGVDVLVLVHEGLSDELSRT